MISTHTSCDHNAYHRRFRDTWSRRAKEVTRPFAFQAKVPETAKNQHKSELLIRSHPRGRGFESLQVHQNKRSSERMASYFVMDRGIRGSCPERVNPFRPTTKNCEISYFAAFLQLFEELCVDANRAFPVGFERRWYSRRSLNGKSSRILTRPSSTRKPLM